MTARRSVPCLSRLRCRLLRLLEMGRTIGTMSTEGIVNLAARGMLVVSVVRRLGSESPLLAYCGARSKGAGPRKGALGPLS
jgi:hypothetical protein